MMVALTLARRSLGNVWPNPAVGCVLVGADGSVVGRGWTQPGGRPHAETEALKQAGFLAKDSTAYVTLEPCSHYGETPPCAEALIAADVARVVVAVDDPDARVSGRGIAMLRDAGIDVKIGVCTVAAEKLNAGFLLHRREGRPLVTLKTASTLDARISTHGGQSQWITGEEARRRGQLLRSTHDAIAVGIGTALADDPELTCRLPGMEGDSPVRIIFDTHLQLPLDSKLVQSARKVPTWIVVSTEISMERQDEYTPFGVEFITVEPGVNHHPETLSVLKALAVRGLTRLLVEGGGGLSAVFLRAGLVDRLAWFRASSVMGGDGTPVFAAYGVEQLSDMRRFVLESIEPTGNDMLETYRVAD
ncbi:MAG: riboflavin biosynthesis protein RibD [Rickettsiales bacterium]|nr:riboflavin biosynthesis protein RibD [Rickettsiales bacterium]